MSSGRRESVMIFCASAVKNLYLAPVEHYGPDLVHVFVSDRDDNVSALEREVYGNCKKEIGCKKLVEHPIDTRDYEGILASIIEIKKDSNLFFFLTNMQDEVHRFAITYHKKLRQKAMYKSVLDDIPGLGPKTRVKLLRKYKTIANLRTLSKEELETVLNKKVAETLYNKLREENA